MYTLEDLPDGASKLIEGIEIVGTTTALSGNMAYNIRNINKKWLVTVGNPMIVLEIPENISQHTPARTTIDEIFLKTITKLNQFENEIKELKILVTKKRNQRISGYTSDYMHTMEIPHWEFLFLDQSKFVDFYLICEKYDLI
ncbi:hypothetical protein D3C87_79860 [compost metagenome]